MKRRITDFWTLKDTKSCENACENGIKIAENVDNVDAKPFISENNEKE